MSDSFYIFLPSNVSSGDYFENKIGNYTTKLSTRICLQDSYEVAMTEISYTKSWYNLQEDSYISIKKYGALTPYPTMVEDEYVRIRAGCYENIKSLIDKINSELKHNKFP